MSEWAKKWTTNWVATTKEALATARVDSQWGERWNLGDDDNKIMIDDRKTEREWHLLEVRRIENKGGKARMGTRTDKNGDTWCWLERPDYTQVEVKDD